MKNALIELTQSLYKQVDIEIQYLLYQVKGSWKAEQISSNGTPQSADLIPEFLVDAIAGIRSHGVTDVVIVHNHPAAHPKPSFMDYYNHQTIESYLRLFGLKAVDYLIVSPFGYYSFEEDGRMTGSEYQVSLDTPVSIPLSLSSLDEVESQTSVILDTLEAYEEILVTPNGSYAASSLGFASFFEKFEEIKGNHLFFCKRQDDEYYTRLNDVYKVFSPLEIFQVQEDTLVPLVVNGVMG